MSRHATNRPFVVETIKWFRLEFINVDQLIKAHQGQYKLPSKPVLLTVDDGYQSFYQNAYPVIRAKKIPVVLAVVGSWLEPKENQNVDFGGESIARNKILSWDELKEMQNSGLVEIASHSYHLHQGINANPQGNLSLPQLPAFMILKAKVMKMIPIIRHVSIRT